MKPQRSTYLRMSWFTPVLFLGACATVSPGSRPDDMSAARHRKVSAKYQKEAKAHEKQYDPKAQEWRSGGSRGGGHVGHGSAGVIEDFDTSYNPTDNHLSQATENREHARQHRVAAEKLEKFESASCRLISKDKRVICPLLGVVERVQKTKNGTRLFLIKGTPLKAALAHMKCHYSYGRVVGRKGMNNCPLYLKNLKISISQDGQAIDITGSDAGAIKEIQRRSDAHVVTHSTNTP